MGIKCLGTARFCLCPDTRFWETEKWTGGSNLSTKNSGMIFDFPEMAVRKTASTFVPVLDENLIRV